MRLKSAHELDATEGTVQLRAQSGPARARLILHPRPAAHDPNDPLRWPAWRKRLCFGSVGAFAFLANFGVSALAPALPAIAAQFRASQARASSLVLWPLLLFGAGNFAWVPLAGALGRRPAFALAAAVCAGAMAWGAAARSFDALFASTMLATAAGSCTEALGAALVNDLFFLHERGACMGVYIVCIAAGNSIGPLVCGFMAGTVGWRWYKGLGAVLVGLDFLLILLCVPETRYLERDFSREGEQLVVGEPRRPADNYDDEQKRPGEAHRDLSCAGPAEPQRPRKSYLAQLSLWSGTPPGTTPASFLFAFVRPLPTIAYPGVLFATLSYGVSLAWVIGTNTLVPFILQAPPYGYSIGVSGLINIPGFVGNVAGALFGGWCVDRYSDWSARRSRGVFKPEMRLVLLVVPALLVPAGLLAIGYGFGLELHWTAIFFGFGMLSTATTATPVIGMTYVSDALGPISTDALLVVNGLKNILAFAFTYAIVPWGHSQGYINLYGTQAGLYVAIVGLGGFALWYFGEHIRRVTGRWRILL